MRLRRPTVYEAENVLLYGPGQADYEYDRLCDERDAAEERAHRSAAGEPGGTMNAPTTRTAPLDFVGRLVTFLIPSLHGPSRLAGRVIGILPDGRLDVRSQQHGYFKLHQFEVTL